MAVSRAAFAETTTAVNGIGARDRVGGLPGCRLRRVAQYVEQNLQARLRLAELSALVHMSPYHFARLFKRSTGVPPHLFVIRCRIEQARTLLVTQTAPIAVIARLVGFQTPSHFTTTFRRLTGMTPSEYRSGVGVTSAGRAPSQHVDGRS
jgi:AraC family transcriptional regulator